MDLTAIVNEIKTAHDEFKRTNDERLASLATKGHVDGLLEEKLATINAVITRLDGEMKDANTRANRVQLYSATGQVLETLSDEDKEHKAAMLDYLRKGRKEPLEAFQTKAGVAGSDPDGGYFVSKPTQGRMVSRLFETTTMRSYAHIETISGDKLEFPVDNDEADSGWVGETTPRNDTNTPAIQMGGIPVYEIYAQPKQTQRMLDDAAYDVEAWLANKVADRFARQENRAFAVGDGVNKPFGIFAKPATTEVDAVRKWGVLQYVKSGAAGGFKAANASPADPLLDLVYSLKAGYRTNANFLMPRLVEGECRKIKDGNGQYLWQPSVQAGKPSTLLGYGIDNAEDAPALSAGSFSIAFGDYKEGYTIVDRIGIRVLRDPFTAKPWVRFYTTKRVGGDVVNSDAIKLMKFEA